MSKSVFIVWDEDDYANLHHEYIGGGEYKVVGTPIITTKRARYSNDTSKASLEKAKRYILEDPPREYQKNMRVEVLGD